MRVTLGGILLVFGGAVRAQGRPDPGVTPPPGPVAAAPALPDLELPRLDVSDLVTQLPLSERLKLSVVTATRTEEELFNSPSTVRVITAGDINAFGYNDLEMMLHDQPGFDFARGYGVYYSNIYMRGFRSSNSDRFLLLYDNILQNDIWKQAVQISRQYSITNIKRVEILYGPASALYGTNAFSGIINIITKEGKELGPGNLYAGFGSDGRRFVEASSGAEIVKNGLLEGDITARYFAASDLHPWPYMRRHWPDDFSTDYRTHLNQPQLVDPASGTLKTGITDGSFPYDEWSVHANLISRPEGAGKFKLSMVYWVTRELQGYWYQPFKRSTLTAPDYWDLSSLAFRGEHSISKGGFTNTASATYREHAVLPSPDASLKYCSTPEGIQPDGSKECPGDVGINPADPNTYKFRYAGTTTDSGTRLHGYGSTDIYGLRVWDVAAEEQASYSWHKRFSITGGGRFVHTNTQEDYYILAANNGQALDTAQDTDPRRHRKETGAVYAQVKLDLVPGKLLVFVGGRGELQRDESGNGYQTAVPRASVILHPTDTSTIRAQYAEAFQEADDFHKFATDSDVRPLPSPNLGPEHIRTVELAGNYLFGNLLSVDAAVYYNQVSDLIVDVPNQGNPNQTHFENRGGARIAGYEVGLQLRPLRTLSLYADFSGAWNWIEIDCVQNPAGCLLQAAPSTPTMKYLPYGDIAQIKVDFGATARLFGDSLVITVNGNYVGPRDTINCGNATYVQDLYSGQSSKCTRDPTKEPITTTVDGYFILSAYIGWIPFRSPHRIELGVRGNNIFNTTYFDPGVRTATGSYNSKILQPGFNYLATVKASF
jgi:outer membrane receptor protein involved in Fe transport